MERVIVVVATKRRTAPETALHPFKTLIKIMKNPGSLMCAVGLVALVVPAAQAAGVLADPGFEGVVLVDDGNGVGKWNPFAAAPATFEVSTTLPNSGAEHLRLTLAGGNLFAGVFQDVSVFGGEEITFSGMHAASNNDPGSAIEIRIEWRDSVNNMEVSRTANQVPAPGTQYEMFSLTETAPAGADTARLVYAIQSFGGNTDAVVDVDDVSVTGVPEPSSALLFSLGVAGLAARRRR